MEAQPPDLLIPSFGSLDLGVRVDLNRLHHSSRLSPMTRLTVLHCNSFNLESKSIHHPRLQPLSLTNLHLLPCCQGSAHCVFFSYVFTQEFTRDIHQQDLRVPSNVERLIRFQRTTSARYCSTKT
ncbi:hypothetical protein YC2023_099773 [Brassica napus]